MNKRDNIIKWTIVSIFVLLYTLVSTISTIHVIDFFKLSNPDWLAITLAIAFEIGAAASLGAIVILDKTSKALVWMLFILITVMQMMGNMYYAYSHIHNFQGWIELFGLNEEEPIFQKRVLSIVSGAILPIVALGFIKSLVDYIRPGSEVQTTINDQITDSVTQEIEVEEPNDNLKKAKEVWARVSKLHEEGKLPPRTEDDLVEPSALAFTPYEVEEDYSEDEENIEEIENEIEDIKEDEEKESQKTHTDIEVKLAKAIAKNPELKEKLNEEIKKLEAENDKYSKPNESDIANINTSRRTFGGM
jgi:hypothetical protein